MPSAGSLIAAGRYDLHHAILAYGGYREVQARLDRRPAWPRVDLLRDRDLVKSALRQVSY